MKKFVDRIRPHITGLTIIIICGFVAALPFFSDKLIVGNDFFFNQARIQSTANGLKDGQLIPQLDPSAFGGWGHSWNLFYGPLPTYLVLPIKVFTTWPIAINILSILLLIASGITMYLFALTVTKKRKIALLAALLFMLASPLIVTAFRSNNQSRMLVVALMPLVFDGIYRIINKAKYGIPILTLSATGIILSHMLSAVIVAAAAVMFIAANIKRLDRVVFINILKSAVIIIGLSAFFLLPFLEAQLSGIYNITNKEFQMTAMSMVASTAFESSITPGALLFRNQEYPISGIYLQLWVLIGTAATVFLAKNNMPKNLFRACCYLWVVLLTLLILCTPYFPWDKMPSALYTLQFPSRRLLPIITFVASIIGAIGVYYLLPKTKSPKINEQIFNTASMGVIVTCFLVLAPTIGFYSQNSYSSLQPAKTLTYVDDSTTVPESVWKNTVEPLAVSSGEYLPSALSVAGNRNPNSTRYYSYTIASANYLIHRGNQPQTINNKTILTNFTKNGSHMSVDFRQKEQTTATIEMPAIYYPGYKAVIETNAGRYDLPTRQSTNGLLAVDIPAQYKDGKVKIWYGLSYFSIIGGLTTVVTTVIITLYLVIRTLRHRRKKS